MTSEGPKEKAPIFLCVKVGKLTKKRIRILKGPDWMWVTNNIRATA